MFSEKMVMAFRFAAEAHVKQKRKSSNTPYIAHPMAVASLVLEHGGGEDVFCAALLHDVIEDCGVTEERLSGIFGETVVTIVKAVTNPPIDWKSFKSDVDLQETLKVFRNKNFEKLRGSEVQIQLLSACDKLHNARGIMEDLRRAQTETGEGKPPSEVAQFTLDVWNKFRGKREGTLWYYIELSKVYSESESPQVRLLGRALRDVCESMDALA